MENTKHIDNVGNSITASAKWFQENLFNPIGFMQLAAVGMSYLIAWLLASKIQQHLEKDIQKVNAHMWFVSSPVHLAIVLKHFFWLLLVWFFQILSRKLTMPTDFFRTTLSLILVLMIVRFASFYIKSAFWSRFVYAASIIFLALRIFNLWGPTVQLLESMTIDIGRINISLFGAIYLKRLIFK